MSVFCYSLNAERLLKKFFIRIDFCIMLGCSRGKIFATTRVNLRGKSSKQYFHTVDFLIKSVLTNRSFYYETYLHWGVKSKILSPKLDYLHNYFPNRP